MMLKSVAVATALVGSANAFWRMECPARVGLGRIDPIMDPGNISTHVHALHGSSGMGTTADTSSLLAGDCTSCRVTQDQSGYWHPALYFQDGDTGEYELVEQVGGMLAYYLLYGDNVTAFPPNFRMLSGDSTRRTYTAGDPSKPDPDKSMWASLGQTGQDTLAQRALGFNCLNYAKDPEGTLYRHYLPDKSYLDANCADGIRFELMFPSCWKGGDEVDSEDHKSHVAFPDLVMTGNCPDDYPVRVPSLLYEVIWNTAAYTDRNGEFVIANNDKTGYGYHGDFITGWPDDFLQQAVDTCTNPSGLIEDCALFDIVDEATASECQMKMPSEIAHENVTGPIAALPGSSSQGSPTSAPTSTSESEASSKPTLTYNPGESASASASPLPGQVFKESSTTTPAPTSTSPDANVAVLATASSKGAMAVAEAPEVTSAPKPSSTGTESFFSTEYITNGDVVSEILWEEEFVTVTEYQDVTTTVTTPSAPAGRRRRRAAHVHAHGHGRF